MSKVDRIMLKFRPIAPKPAVSSASAPEKSEPAGKSGRGKRSRHVKEAGTRRCNSRRKKVSPSADQKKASGVVLNPVVPTLTLLPETPERRESCCGRNAPVWLSFEGGSNRRKGEGFVADRAAAVVAVPEPVRMVPSWVTVERVAETWVEGDGEGLGCTDEERRRNLERDTCPGFISDGGGKVTWTNGAYREMVGGGKGEAVRVWLEMKETAEERWPAFTCRVKVQYRCRWGKEERTSLTVPCDVWRMEGGGYAWRLDVGAALSLGLGR